MTIQILGTGCPKCKALEANSKKAIENLGIDATVEKITDIDKIMEMGVMVTPALAIDGKVKTTGRFLNQDQIANYIKEKA